MKYQPTAKYNVIYLYTIHDSEHEGKIKVGKTELYSIKSFNQLTPNCPELVEASRKRIDQQTRTAMVVYELLHCEVAVCQITMQDGSLFQASFSDDDIHDVLKNSGYRPEVFRDNGRDSEWFKIDIETVFKAISSYKDGLSIIPVEDSPIEKIVTKKKIILREEQANCVKKTISIFKKENEMLWDCKMRFGKTITAYELIKEAGFKKTIVVTHRPAVEDSWDTDHQVMFGGTSHKFIDKTNNSLDGYDDIMDSQNDKILSDMVDQDIPFVYFASIQDLRGSKKVGGKYNKNNGVFDIDWDLVIVDEAHEGIQDNLGEVVVKALRKENTKLLSLSGTAYNLTKDYGDNVFTWTYVDEQKKKHEWDSLHPGEKNPYEDLPTMNILTFDISEAMENTYKFVTAESAFNFREFFRTWTGDILKDYYKVPENKSIGDFVHEDSIWSFLNLISKEDGESNYPFSNEEYRDMFAHTFWIVPGVREAKALSKLLQSHPFFSQYKIVNVAGDGDEEEQYDIALNKVKTAISVNDRTITLSCGRLTTGITVREWTGIMMLSGSAETSVNGYMQAIFRVQSPGTIKGKRKENCYVFDFAPDRALKVIGNVHKLSSKTNIDDEKLKVRLGEFLNFCPIISVEGTEMRTYDVPEMMRQIKRISVENAINSGFDDNTIYLSDAGLSRSDSDLEVLRKLSDVVAPKKKGQRDTSVLINQHGMTEEERQAVDVAKKKQRQKVELTEKEKEALEKYKEAKKEQQKLFDLLRAVSIRLPLLFYGADADITQIIHLKDFVEIVDDESWGEFMPKGLRKELFLDILRFYDEDVLVGAGLRIRKLAKACDEYPPTIRLQKIIEIISKFKNPDKETVLTPWRVVNMHLGDTFGGYNFYDESYSKELDEPRFVQQDATEDILLNEDVKILEMNSKSGLYPLYMAFSIYRFNAAGQENEQSFEYLQNVWNNVLVKNIFVLCKTKMARSITIRTLAGYTGAKVNAIYLPHLLETMRDDLDRFKKKMTNPVRWEINAKEGERMKFDVVIGNPPYQLENSGDGNGKDPVYHLFMDASRSIAKRGSLIHPARFLFNAGKTPAAWNEKMLQDEHFKVVKYYDDSTDIFPTVDIKGGVAITMWNEFEKYVPISTFSPFEQIPNILQKVKNNDFVAFSENVYPMDLYRINETLYEENSWAEGRQSKGHRYAMGSNIFDVFPELFYDEKPNDTEEYVQVLGLKKAQRTKKWFKKKYIKLPDNFESYRVFIAKVNGAGVMGEALANPVVVTPNIAHSATFLSVGKYSTETEANATLKYLKTKFVRVLLGTLKVTHDNPKRVWLNVPLQDFTSKSDIDWTKSVSDIDQQLYKKYQLTEQEIDFLENKAVSME